MEDKITEKLFYQDSYMKEFTAVVMSCEADGEFYQVVLDKTAFFPEGGGQYADTGILEEAEVSDAKEKKGIIYHKVNKKLDVGMNVSGKIHWVSRFEKMQQHSAEHIVSGLVHQSFGYDNVGFHLSDEYCTLDFNGPITKDELLMLEYKSNEAVYKNMDIIISYPIEEELKSLEYRSKIEIEGQVRIVTIPGYDICACCAPQVKKTGEIGLIKLVNMMNYKGGVRITMLCGFRALKDYCQKQEIVKTIGALLCEKEENLTEAVERIQSEQSVLKSKIGNLHKKLLSDRAENMVIDERLLCIFDQELEGAQLRELMNLLLERGANICAIFSGTDEKGYRYVIGSRSEDVRGFSKILNEAFDGKGGGKPEMVQGSLLACEKEIRNIIGS